MNVNPNSTSIEEDCSCVGVTSYLIPVPIVDPKDAAVGLQCRQADAMVAGTVTSTLVTVSYVYVLVHCNAYDRAWMRCASLLCPLPTSMVLVQYPTVVGRVR